MLERASVLESFRPIFCDIIALAALSRYNHQAYRIQAVDWTMNPDKTFSTRVKVGPDQWESKDISFRQYYVDVYGRLIESHFPATLTRMQSVLQRYHAPAGSIDAGQPLLAARPANKLLRRKGTEQIYLLPQFCRMTGYTDQIRQDFRLMQAVSKHTKLDPARRKQETENFVRKLTRYEVKIKC